MTARLIVGAYHNYLAAVEKSAPAHGLQANGTQQTELGSSGQRLVGDDHLLAEDHVALGVLVLCGADDLVLDPVNA